MAIRNITAFGDAIIPHRTLVGLVLAGTSAATAGNYGSAIFIADESYEVVSVKGRQNTAGTDAGAVTVMLRKASSGTALSAGTAMLSAGMSLKTAANTNYVGSLHATVANRRIVAGQAIGFVLTGAPTSAAGLCLTVELKRIK